jgi:hypothetical protein
MQYLPDENQDATRDISSALLVWRIASFDSVWRCAGCEWIFKDVIIGSGNVLVEVNTAVRKLAELSSFLDLCSSKVQSASAILL